MYYVYAYLRRDDTPYYIGKGKDQRAWSKNHKGIGVPKDQSRIKILENNLSEEQAKTLEIELISKFGRKDLGTGILRNRTNGGEGASGRILSNGTKELLRNAATKAHRSKVCGFSLGHASKAGSIGGKSTSPIKQKSSLVNLEKTREVHKNSIWVHHPGTKKRKRVKEDVLNYFLSQGFIKGFAL